MKLTTDEEILETISSHTGMLRAVAWLKNIKSNERLSGFTKNINLLKNKHFNQKAIIIGAGPAFKRFGLKDLEILKEHPEIIKISCDGALPTLAKAGITIDYVVSVDAHPVVADFYRYWFDNMKTPLTALLSTTIHRNVVDLLEKHNSHIYWWQGFKKTDKNLPSWTGNGKESKLFVKDIPTIMTGGNVGTTSYILAVSGLMCSPIGLLGLEFSWSDETPLMDTQYFGQLMSILGNDKDVSKQFKKIVNERDGKTYVADPVYYTYYLAFKELYLNKLDDIQRKSTYNLTKEGILQIDGLQTISMKEFVDK